MSGKGIAPRGKGIAPSGKGIPLSGKGIPLSGKIPGDPGVILCDPGGIPAEREIDLISLRYLAGSRRDPAPHIPHISKGSSRLSAPDRSVLWTCIPSVACLMDCQYWRCMS